MSEFVIAMTSKILSKNDTLTQSVCNAPMQRCFLKKSRNLSMDGPSVSWNVLEKLDDYLTNKDLLKLFILETITSIYCAKLFKLSFRILVGMLIKSWISVSDSAQLSSKKGNLLSKRWWRCLSIEVINPSPSLIVHCCWVVIINYGIILEGEFELTCQYM